MKRNKIVLTLTALVLAGTVSACSTPVTSASNDNHAPMVAGQTQATQGTDSQPSASPSVSPTATSKPRVAPATKGVVTDGTSTWVQTTINATDPDFQVDLSSVTDETKKKLSKQEWQAAWEGAATFIAEEGIDSPMRNATAARNPDIFKKWVEDNRSRFSKNAKFVLGDPDKGNELKNRWGIAQDSPNSGFSYNTGESKPRIIERSISTGTVDFHADDSSVTFHPLTSYQMKVMDAGKFCVWGDEPRFDITMVKEGEKWVVKTNNATFYEMNPLGCSDKP